MSAEQIIEDSEYVQCTSTPNVGRKRFISLDQVIDEVPGRLEKWKNISEGALRLEIYLAPPSPDPRRAGKLLPPTWALIDVAAGETVEIPKSLGAAIQQIDPRTGLVCGGVAPLAMRRVGGQPPFRSDLLPPQPAKPVASGLT